MFIHLHCHSDRTIGKSIINPTKLVTAYSSRGDDACCITDTGNLSAAIQLYNACRKQNIKPIFGLEVNITYDKSLKDQKSKTLVLIAQNEIGFKNLVKITTLGSMYFYYSPRVDLASLSEFSEGLLCLTSDLRGFVADRYMYSVNTGIEKAVSELQEIYDDRIYLEVQLEQSEIQRSYNQALMNFASSSNFKLVVSGDPHYIRADDKFLYEKFLEAKNARNPYWNNSMKGSYHLLDEDEVVNEIESLHGEGFVMANEIIQEAIWENHRIVQLIETFDLRKGVKIPSFIE